MIGSSTAIGSYGIERVKDLIGNLYKEKQNLLSVSMEGERRERGENERGRKEKGSIGFHKRRGGAHNKHTRSSCASERSASFSFSWREVSCYSNNIKIYYVCSLASSLTVRMPQLTFRNSTSFLNSSFSLSSLYKTHTKITNQPGHNTTNSKPNSSHYPLPLVPHPLTHKPHPPNLPTPSLYQILPKPHPPNISYCIKKHNLLLT